MSEMSYLVSDFVYDIIEMVKATNFDQRILDIFLSILDFCPLLACHIFFKK
jgi:hypothetical protein